MPRGSGRGGARTGTPGTAYPNRTDLSSPISTVPKQGYGKAADQRRAQEAVPMASSPVAAAPAPAQQRPVAAPGSMPYLDETQRPNEPVTAGIDYGPGAGSEAIGNFGPTLGQILAQAAGGPHTSALSMQLSDSARSMGL